MQQQVSRTYPVFLIGSAVSSMIIPCFEALKKQTGAGALVVALVTCHDSLTQKTNPRHDSGRRNKTADEQSYLGKGSSSS
jgi:hypothetical protein